MLHLYLEDADAAYQRALDAGATSLREPEDQFYGDRTAGVKDDFGNQWWLATHIEDVTPEEMQRRADA
jgi:PhnB protein